MLDVYTAHGMPITYRHWSYGKHFLLHESSYRRGHTNLAYEVAAYAIDKPRALPDMPPVKPMKVARDGKIVVCYADTECARKALAHASRAPTCRWIETNITRNYLGVGGTPQRYVILVIPPKASDK